MHTCVDGLSDDVIQLIAKACQLVRCDSGEILHSANHPIDSVYLLIHGRIVQSLFDIQGNLLMRSDQTSGGQLGALGAALGEPIPIEMVAAEPTTLLRLDYPTILELTRQHDAFRQRLNYLVADSVRTLLTKERRHKRPRLVAIFHQAPTTRPITQRLVERLHDLGESPSLFTDKLDGRTLDNVPSYGLVQDGEYISGDQFRRQMDSLPDSRRVFIDVDAALDVGLAAKVVESSELVYWCVTIDCWQEAVQRLREIERHAVGWREKINVVWLLPGSIQWAPLAPELDQLANRSFKVTFDEPPKNRSRELVHGIERIIHQMRGIQIGIALGGGAARGMAHIGVLKALEQHGIVVDRIAGTSAGAMTGILYASGMEPDYNVASFMNDLQPSWFFRCLKNGEYWYLVNKYRRGQFDPMLRKYLGESRLEQLAIPSHSITVDLISGQAIVRDEGDAVHAITESINLPVLSKPINRDGRALVDGGVVNNVPADVLVAKGCNFVIAVSVTEKIRHEFARNRPDTPTSSMKPASAIQTMLRTYIVQNVNMNSVGVRPADFVIQPDVSDFDVVEFTRADEMSEIGANATLAALPKLKRLLAKLDDELFVAN